MAGSRIAKAVILARGLGTRMRRHEKQAKLESRQAAVADTGVKALIPIDRPFLDYVLSALAEAGYAQVCLVVGPEHDELRDYYGRQLKTKRLKISFAMQEQPLGTADAVLAAREFTEPDEFLVINSDNYYPVEALYRLRRLSGAALAVFDRESMLRKSNILPQRLRSFAVVETTETGHLERIIEKPDEQTLKSLAHGPGISMNCWRFRPLIFQACESIQPSKRGELEIPDAVQYAIEKLKERFTVVPVKGAVLDLSYRHDVAPVAKLLAGIEVKL